MNSNAQNYSDSSVPVSEASTSNLQPPTPFTYRGNGKVARLPKPIRDQICKWMLDGVSYPDIIQRLGEHGKDLNPGHLCEWKKRGFQDWLLEQAWLAETRARQEPAAALSADFDATQLNHAALQLGTLHIFEALRDLRPGLPCPSDGSGVNAEGTGNRSGDAQAVEDPVAVPSPRGEGQGEGEQTALLHSVPELKTQNSKLKTSRPRSQLDLKLGGDSAAFVRLLNALARASRETMLVQKYRDACAQARAALDGLKDPNRKLSQKETRAIVRKVDQILGFTSPEDDESEASPSFAASEPLVAPKSDGGGTDRGFTTPKPLVALKSDGSGSNGGLTAPKPLVAPKSDGGGSNGKFTAPEQTNGGFAALAPTSAVVTAPEPLVALMSDGSGSACEPPSDPPWNGLPPLLPLSW